ncbi:MAG: hypothetical protein IKP88_17360 [Lachnospiraceae bacterium]|nr:hypothetical protein [Lachnospiraceae bacterium]
MLEKSFATKIIATIMMVIIAVSFAAQTNIYAYEEATGYKTTVRNIGKDRYELIVVDRTIDEATIASICGMLASLDGFDVTRERIITSFNMNPKNFEYTYKDYSDKKTLNNTFKMFYPGLNPEGYTIQTQKDMINIRIFMNLFLADLWKIQRSGTTLYCSMF